MTIVALEGSISPQISMALMNVWFLNTNTGCKAFPIEFKTDPSYGRTTHLDMVLGNTLGLFVTMA